MPAVDGDLAGEQRVAPRVAVVEDLDPATAYRSANGIVLSWWTEEWGGSTTEARLEILDSTGAVVRTLEPAVEGEDRDRWSGPALPVAAGWNRLRWDLRTDPAATEVVVERYPWIEGVADEDPVGQYEFGVRIRGQVDRANRAVIADGTRPAEDRGRARSPCGRGAQVEPDPGRLQ